MEKKAMNEPQYFIGVDVAKTSLSVCVLYANTFHHFTIENSKDEIIKFFTIYANVKSFVTFENTNTYNYELMRALELLAIDYARLDAFKFSHFLKHNSKIKNDETDAYALALYASKFYDKLAKSSFDESFALIKSYQSGLALINKINTQILNFNHALESVNNPRLACAFREVLDELETQKKVVEDEAFKTIKELLPITELILAENKGFGKVFAIYVLPIFYLNPDKNAEQLSSYVGLVPKVYESGTSIKSGGSINGGARLARNALFMSSLSASRFHPHFNTIYKRLIARGKPSKKALVAVSHSIIKYVKKFYFGGQK